MTRLAAERGNRWVIAGGGTGGHVTPGLALAECIAADGDDVLFLGSARGIESRLVPQAGFGLHTLPAQQVVGRGWAGRIRALFTLFVGSLAATWLLARRRPDVVLCVGGYAAVPAVVAATLLRIPLALVEPNALPGRTNRLAARVARRVFLAFEAARESLPGVRAERVRVVGVPLRRSLVEAFSEGPLREGLRESRPFHLLVFGGSQGARQINEAVIAALPELRGLAIEVFHQTGEVDREQVSQAYRGSGVPGTVVAFEPNMPDRYRWADLALCRSGALTVAELTLAALPALLVPYPFAADDHQRANALELEAAGGAILLTDSDLQGEGLARAIGALVEDRERLGCMRECSAKLARPDATRRVVDECRTLLGGTS